MQTVEQGEVDKASVRGIWANKDEAWAGIDDLFPTVDDPVLQPQTSSAAPLASMLLAVQRQRGGD